MRYENFKITLATLVAVVELSSFVASGHEVYVAYDLGILPGFQSSAASDINNAGVIVGTCSSNNIGRAFYYSNGVMHNLGVITSKLTNSLAFGINDAGTIVGRCESGGTYPETRAFQCQAGAMSVLPLGGLASWANGLNDSGLVVGHVRTNSSNGLGFVYDNGAVTNLGVLGGSFSEAFGVNSNGTIVGYSTIEGSSARHAFVRSNAVMLDLGTLGGASSVARKINGAGVIVGDSDVSGGGRHAFVCAEGVMTDIGNLGSGYPISFATDINNQGKIVGYSSTHVAFPSFGTARAFSYANGVMTDLSPFLEKAGLRGSSQAAAINDSGWIVGFAGQSGAMRAFLLKPDPSPVLTAFVSNGVTQLIIQGDIGTRFAIEHNDVASSDTGWVTLATNTLVSNPQAFADETTTGIPIRFYRARIVP